MTDCIRASVVNLERQLKLELEPEVTIIIITSIV
jgi:hypothetical protein